MIEHQNEKAGNFYQNYLPFMAEMERFARRGHRAGTHTGNETCHRHVSLAQLVPFSNLSMLYEKQTPPPSAGEFVFMAEMERFELSKSF